MKLKLRHRYKIFVAYELPPKWKSFKEGKIYHTYHEALAEFSRAQAKAPFVALISEHRDYLGTQEQKT